jgi:hypothetical protein
MRHYPNAAIGFIGIILLATGCGAKGERIDLKVPIAYGVDKKVAAMSSGTVAVLPFEDNRTNRSHLGTDIIYGEERVISIFPVAPSANPRHRPSLTISKSEAGMPLLPKGTGQRG